jgi:hypothetical protein
VTPILLSSVFTIEIDGKPILSFEAINIREAHELCHESWLKCDLLEATSPACRSGMARRSFAPVLRWKMKLRKSPSPR